MVQDERRIRKYCSARKEAGFKTILEHALVIVRYVNRGAARRGSKLTGVIADRRDQIPHDCGGSLVNVVHDAVCSCLCPGI